MRQLANGRFLLRVDLTLNLHVPSACSREFLRGVEGACFLWVGG